MGQKVHPVGFRLGYTETWDSRWFDKREFADKLHEDLYIKRYIKTNLYHAGISRIQLERKGEKAIVTIHTARPGIIIGKRGGEVDRLRDTLQKAIKKSVSINIQEVKTPEIEAQLVAENIASQLLKRISFRRALKRAISFAMQRGAKGIKIMASGRLDGSEMGRKEWYKDGRIPLQTLRADIDYGFAEALTVSGQVGIKVWIFHGEKMDTAAMSRMQAAREAKEQAALEAAAEENVEIVEVQEEDVAEGDDVEIIEEIEEVIEEVEEDDDQHEENPETASGDDETAGDEDAAGDSKQTTEDGE